MWDLRNKIIFITGASSGIGEACARVFAQFGAKLILTARRTRRLETLAAELKEKHQTESLVRTLDVSDRHAIEDVCKHLPEAWCSVDVLLNNAGLALGTDPIQQGDPDQWETMIDTNIKGLLNITRQIIPGMIERNKGHIVNIGSVAGQNCYENGNVYCATKHAVRAITQCLRLDLAGKPVRVTEIAPGAVKSEFSVVRWNDIKRADTFYENFTPLTPADVADAVLYCITRPSHVNISELTMMSVDQSGCSVIHRKNGAVNP